MKIPAYIDNALKQRARTAARLGRLNDIIDDFLIKNGISDEIELCDYGYGAEVVCAPYDSAERVREAILKHEKG